MAFNFASQDTNMLRDLDAGVNAGWLSESKREACRSAHEKLTNAIAAFAASPTDERLRDLNNVWWVAKRALRGDGEKAIA